MQIREPHATEVLILSESGKTAPKKAAEGQRATSTERHILESERMVARG